MGWRLEDDGWGILHGQPPGAPGPVTVEPLPPTDPDSTGLPSDDPFDDREAGYFPDDDAQLEADLEAEEFATGARFLAATGNKPGDVIATIEDHLSRACGCAAWQGWRGCSNTVDARRSGRAGALQCWQSNHALDIYGPKNYAVRTPRDGIVSRKYGHGISATGGKTAGYRLHVEHPTGMVTFYTHLQDDILDVGVRVKQGDVLGHIGYWGFITHVHFAVSLPFNPSEYASLIVTATGRRRPGTPQPKAGDPSQPPVTPIPKAKTIEDAWSDFTKVQGTKKRNAQTALSAARKKINKAVE